MTNLINQQEDLEVCGEAHNAKNALSGIAATAGVVSGASCDNQKFLEAGGTDMLDGDGRLNYGWEKVLETYYGFQIWKTVHATLDYQFVTDPAFNRNRGPLSIFGARLHWQF